MMSEKTTVINIRSGQPYDVYVGRAVPRRGLAGSIWGNPFKIGRDGSREDVIAKYRQHVLTVTGLASFLDSIRGKTLACWCKPDSCHADVLAGMAEQRHAAQAAPRDDRGEG